MADTIIIETPVATVLEVGGPQGPQGPQGATGATGSAGAAGQGVPTGGTTGQVLRKASGTNYDTEWGTGGGGSVTYGTTAGTACEGNDARLSNARSPLTHTHPSADIADLKTNGNAAGLWDSVNDEQLVSTGDGELIIRRTGQTYGGAFNAGQLTADRGYNLPDASGTFALEDDARFIDGVGANLQVKNGTNAGAFTGGAAGNISLNGGVAAAAHPTAGGGGSGGAGGSINLSGGAGDQQGGGGTAGGSINLSGSSGGGGPGAGGSIDLSNGGGSISTRGTGSIGLGVTGTRTTLVGSASGSDKTVTLPNATGTVALTQQATDYEVTDSSAGIIMKSPNNSRWRITIDNNGVLLRTALALIFSLSFMCGARAQVRDLVYGTNNVVIGPTNTNALSFTNSVAFNNPITFGTNAPTTRTNLGVTVASNLPAPYSGAAASNSLLTADGAGGSSFVANRITTIVKSADQSKTNTADMTVAGNNDPELTVSVVAGTIYSIQARLQYTAPSTGGLNAAIVTGTNNVFVNTGGPVGFASRDDLNARVFYITTASGGAVAGISWGGAGSSTGGTNLIWAATGVFRAENSGTLTLRWAQNITNATPTTLKAGSSFTLTKLN